MVFVQQRALFHEQQIDCLKDVLAKVSVSKVLNQFSDIVNKDAVLVYIESGPVIL